MVRLLQLAVFMLETHNLSGRTWANIFSASVKFIWCKDRHKTYAYGQTTTFKLVSSLQRCTKLDNYSSRCIMHLVKGKVSA